MELTSSAFAIARPPRSFFLLPSRFRSVRAVLRVRDFPIACQAFACQDDEEELRVSTLDLGPEPLVVLVYVSLLDRKGNNTHAKCTHLGMMASCRQVRITAGSLLRSGRCPGVNACLFVRPLTSQIASDMTSFCILLILPSAYSLTPSCEINGVDQRGRGGALDTPFLDNLLPM